MSKITIKQIAETLGLSVSSISKALNDSYEISEETKKRVRDYAKEHNYKPNRLAKSLKGGHSNTIGVVVCSINNIFVSQILDGIQKASYETEYDIIVMQSHENIENEKSCIEALLNKGVDGILLAPVSETSNTEYLCKINSEICPIVLFDRFNPSLDTIKVGVNEYKGALQATQHLIRINRKKILFITGSQFGENNPRIQGYKKALKTLDIPFNNKLMLACNLENNEILNRQISEAITELLKSKVKPNAIFGATGVISIQVLGILAQMKIKVPDEIAVIGFSNFDMPFALNPPLSSIRQPTQEIGFMALTKLVDLLNMEKHKRQRACETILLDTTIDFRKSTDL
ncbi:LacI family transcriptional regulator [Chryseobacterium piperi]|uniref:LacI family transcriptional regulator n=1 Tax=Chryseobacterium piperi TaxID=558152 RepID=A0A086B9P8_9FLAO|nr:LacI family DNA-binding transcriptional regulator [Chryseobacterium piperi]ASW73590.1 LacI family transcriptional regulator [Chryseobacterium piperi]KFF25662.1 LacI family transcriptional regulator [Chryseobacterium piperi]